MKDIVEKPNENLVQRVLSGIQNYRSRKAEKRIIRENTWGGLIPGDIVEMNGWDYLYTGINKHGGPGMPEMPEPVFKTPYPTDPDVIFYLRPKQLSSVFPMDVFGEELPPVAAGCSSTTIAFINGTGITKVGHLSPEEWRTGKYLELFSERYDNLKRQIETRKQNTLLE